MKSISDEDFDSEQGRPAVGVWILEGLSVIAVMAVLWVIAGAF